MKTTLTRHVVRVVAALLWPLLAVSYGQQLAVDHVWIHVAKGAPEVKALADAGIQIDRTSGVVQHKGQGTASVFVRFKNIYLELIWIDDEQLLRSVAPDLGHTLLRPSSTSPFGVGLRDLDSELAALPFDTLSYWSEWMRPCVSIAVAKRSDTWPTDPAVFVVPRYMRWDVRTAERPSLLGAVSHTPPLSEVTRIVIRGPGLPSVSPVVRSLLDRKLVDLAASKTHLLELECDNGVSNRTADLRPALPLIVRY
jgi:hypothetical protein